MKLFVGNLPWSIKSADLGDLLRSKYNLAFEYAEVVTERDTGRSRGFGFVHFTNEADLEAAMAALSGQVIDGRVINVDRATSGQGRGGGGRRRDDRGGGGGGRGGRGRDRRGSRRGSDDYGGSWE